jgi:hypothetical protein
LEIVTDLNRALNPFKDVHINFEISYPFDNPDLARYLQRLDEGVRALLPELEVQGVHHEVQGVSPVAIWNNKISEVSLHQGSPLLPNAATENLATQVFAKPGLTLNFFKTPINPATFDVVFSTDRPDIRMAFDDDEERKQIVWKYRLSDRLITFWGWGILSRPETWNSSGRIVSMLDLPGAQLIVRLEYDELASILALFGQPHERINLPGFIRVDIQVGDRPPLILGGRDFELYKGPKGTTNFVYSFPKTFQELTAKIRR